jgi:hypothetical protein
VDAQNVGPVVPLKFWPDDEWIHGRAEKCQEFCGPRFTQFAHATAVALSYPPQELTSYFFRYPHGKYSRSLRSGERLVRDTGPCLSSVIQGRHSEGV